MPFNVPGSTNTATTTIRFRAEAPHYTPEQLEQMDHAEAERAVAAVESARAADVVFVFDVVALPGAEYEALQDGHPHPERDWDPDTFPPALIAASVAGWTETGPDGETRYDRNPTGDEVDELWTTWPQWARTKLFADIVAMNELGVPVGKALSPVNVAAAGTAPTG